MHYYGVKTYKKQSILAQGQSCTQYTPFAFFNKRVKGNVIFMQGGIPIECGSLQQDKQFITIRIPPFAKVRLPEPYRYFKAYHQLKHYVIVGIGGNCGNCLVRFFKLFKRLQAKSVIIATSPILKNKAFGYEAQADFYNMVVWLKTCDGLIDFWSFCAYLERVFGRNRKRPFKNAPRTLDLDLIGFKGKRIHCGGLVIPHAQWNQRLSVVIPLWQTLNLGV